MSDHIDKPKKKKYFDKEKFNNQNIKALNGQNDAHDKTTTAVPKTANKRNTDREKTEAQALKKQSKAVAATLLLLLLIAAGTYYSSHKKYSAIKKQISQNPILQKEQKIFNDYLICVDEYLETVANLLKTTIEIVSFEDSSLHIYKCRTVKKNLQAVRDNHIDFKRIEISIFSGDYITKEEIENHNLIIDAYYNDIINILHKIDRKLDSHDDLSYQDIKELNNNIKSLNTQLNSVIKSQNKLKNKLKNVI